MLAPDGRVRDPRAERPGADGGVRRPARSSEKWPIMGSILGMYCSPDVRDPRGLELRSDHQLIFDAPLLQWALESGRVHGACDDLTGGGRGPPHASPGASSSELLADRRRRASPSRAPSQRAAAASSGGPVVDAPASASPLSPTSTRSAPIARAASMSEARSPTTAERRQVDAQVARRALEHAACRACGSRSRPRAGSGRPRRSARRPRATSARIRRVDLRQVGLASSARARCRAGWSPRPRARRAPRAAAALERAGQERELLPRRHVLALGRLAVDHAVAVEEDRAQASSPARPARTGRARSRVWPSWMRGVSSEGHDDADVGAASRRAPPSPPVSAIVVRPAARAASRPASTFAERPLVEMPSATSPAPPERLDLPGEDALEAVVVGDRRDRRGVVGQRDRRQRAPLEQEAADELGGDVRGVGGAAAVAEREQLAAARERARRSASAARTTSARARRLEQRLLDAPRLSRMRRSASASAAQPSSTLQVRRPLGSKANSSTARRARSSARPPRACGRSGSRTACSRRRPRR